MRVFIATFLLCLSATSEAQDLVIPEKHSEHLNFGAQTGLTVVIFLAPDCPISQNYSAFLRGYNIEFGDTAPMTGFIPPYFDQESIEKFQEKYRIPFALKQDIDLHFSKLLHASVTPEVFLIERSGRVLYRGAIDNWYYELGKHRASVTENYLTDAIRAVVSGEEVKIDSTSAIGCFIELSDNMHH